MKICGDGPLFLTDPYQHQNIPDVAETFYLLERQSRLFISAWKNFRSARVLCHTVFYVGPPEEAQAYSYELGICMRNEEDWGYAEITCPCQPMHNYTMTQGWKNSVPILYDTLKDYFTPNGLEFYIDIQFA